MPKFAANLTMLFNEVDFADRFKVAAEVGFKGVAYLFPCAYPKEQLAGLLSLNGLTQVLHNLPAGNWAAGERGIAMLPAATKTSSLVSIQSYLKPLVCFRGRTQ